MDDGPDRSTIEIKALLKKLSPKGTSNHKDRVRALTRFRNYVSGENSKQKKKATTTAEFYDDDIPLLFLGSESPTALYDDGQFGDLSNYYGLLQACSTPSQKGGNKIKRSARNAMHLVKYLACDHVDLIDGEVAPLGIDNFGLPELNPFAYALCTMDKKQLQVANFEAHVKDNFEGNGGIGNSARNGAKIEACHVLVLLFTRHFDPNVTVSQGQAPPQTLLMEDLLPSKAAKQSFENWMVQNVSKDVQNVIKTRATRAAGGAVSPTVKDAAAQNTPTSPIVKDNQVEVDLDIFKKKTETMTNTQKEAIAHAEAYANEQLDGLELYRKDNNKDVLSGLAETELPTCWKDSKLAQKQIQLGTGIPSAESASLRDLAGVGAEADPNAKDEETIKIEKAKRKKLNARDPLGIRPDAFDLYKVQERAIEFLEDAIQDLDEEMDDFEPREKAAELARRRRRKKDKYAYSVDQLVSLGNQKNTLEAILTGRQDDKHAGGGAGGAASAGENGEDGGEGKVSTAAKDLSIVPTDADFNPMLFLTLVHRDASYEQLKSSISRLENQSDDHIQQIQERVRENFELYIKCADGIDLFSDRAGGSKARGPGVHKRIDNLETLAESCSVEAKKSFKPLLDNTNEVRKVQSALAVLSRIGPILQVPFQMRQHIENGRFSAAVKAYRRVLAIGDDNKIEILRNAKLKAAEAAQDARDDLECRLANPLLPVQSILDSIRSLRELNELEIPELKPDSENKEGNSSKVRSLPRVEVLGSGRISVGGREVNVREHPPSLACLMLQVAHFTQLVNEVVEQTESSVTRVYNGESLAAVKEDNGDVGEEKTVGSAPSTGVDSKEGTDKRERNRWKYDVLESRVLSTIRAVGIARTWLPRLLSIAEASRQAEKRQAARTQNRPRSDQEAADNIGIMQAFEVFITDINPSMRLLVEHVAFCALGCFNGDEGQELKATYGEDTMERLKKLIQSPLPALQTSKCAAEIADLADIVESVADSALTLRPSEDDYFNGFAVSNHNRAGMESALEAVADLVEDVIVTIERRKCIYAFDQCARANAQRASGSGIFDGNAIITCVQTLSDEITRPENCTAEIEKGCELSVHRCCEGLASYVRDRGDSARLRAVSECASVLTGSIDDVVREVSYLTNNQSSTLEDVLVDNVLALEAMMFDEFLESIRRNMSLYCKLGPMLSDDTQEDEYLNDKKTSESQFPSHLSASLLAIVRCRAQVEKALGEKTIRKCQAPSTYLFLAMSTAADSVVDGICYEMSQRMARMRGSQADQYLNELQFLINTLRRYLSNQVLHAAEGCKSKLAAKTGGGMQGQGPDGLGAIERLERLGRLYVMCLGE